MLHRHTKSHSAPDRPLSDNNSSGSQEKTPIHTQLRLPTVSSVLDSVPPPDSVLRTKRSWVKGLQAQLSTAKWQGYHCDPVGQKKPSKSGGWRAYSDSNIDATNSTKEKLVQMMPLKRYMLPALNSRFKLMKN